MARTALAVQQIVRAGLDPDLTEAANSGGESIPNNGDVFVYISNGGGGSINVTFLIPGTIDQQGIANTGRVVAVGAGIDMWCGPFPTSQYNQSDGALYVDFSGVTTVTVAAIRL